MAVPKFYKFFNAFLESLQDGEIHSFRECQEYVKSKFHFTVGELSETIPSGQLRWKNRIYWCKTYLLKAGVISSPRRANLQITESGKQLLRENTIITVKLLSERNPSFATWREGTSVTDNTQDEVVSGSSETPQEIFERVYKEINAELADELLTAVHGMSAQFFERFVVQLMEGMGYGGYEGAGHLTPLTNDGGIDGIIDEDKLGFNRIYIQAKRWALDTVIGRPEIQKFVGALAAQPKVSKGLYITTARFSNQAQEYARNQHIILVDGKKLAELMKYGHDLVRTERIIDFSLFEVQPWLDVPVIASCALVIASEEGSARMMADDIARRNFELREDIQYKDQYTIEEIVRELEDKL